MCPLIQWIFFENIIIVIFIIIIIRVITIINFISNIWSISHYIWLMSMCGIHFCWLADQNAHPKNVIRPIHFNIFYIKNSTECLLWYTIIFLLILKFLQFWCGYLVNCTTMKTSIINYCITTKLHYKQFQCYHVTWLNPTFYK